MSSPEQHVIIDLSRKETVATVIDQSDILHDRYRRNGGPTGGRVPARLSMVLRSEMGDFDDGIVIVSGGIPSVDGVQSPQEWRNPLQCKDDNPIFTLELEVLFGVLYWSLRHVGTSMLERLDPLWSEWFDMSFRSVWGSDRLHLVFVGAARNPSYWDLSSSAEPHLRHPAVRMFDPNSYQFEEHEIEQQQTINMTLIGSVRRGIAEPLGVFVNRCLK